MTDYSEAELRIPVLRLINTSPTGFMTTSSIISEMEEIFKPDGHDILILEGRSDTYFSQKVRNIISHRTSSLSLIKKGYATYHKDRGGLSITESGRDYLKSLSS